MFLQNPHILIVDDERNIRVALRAILEPLTPNLLEAVDGMEALRLAKKHHFDIIFSNLKMPRIDGLELLELLPELGCQAKMIIVSGMLSRQEDILELKKAGAFDALPKPLDKDKIIQTLHNALGAIYREELLMPN
jgi:two-component system, NtrC family, nitrogen regulation response regulator NtrX